MLTNFLLSQYDILLIQEHNLEEAKARTARVIANRMNITAHFTPANKRGRGGSTGIFIKQGLTTDVKFVSSKEGAVTKATFSAFKNKWEFASIYGPQDKNKRKNFFNSKEFSDLITKSTHVGGDFNTVPNTGVDHWSTTTNIYPNIGSKELEKQMARKGLRDELRHTLGPSAKIFTRDTATVRTRLDRWYIPTNNKEMQYTMDIDATWASDHMGVSMEIRMLDKSKRGPGRSRIDPSLLLEDHIRKEILRNWRRTYTKYPIAKWGHAVVFEKFKNSIMATLKNYSKQKKRSQRRDIQLAKDQIQMFEKTSRNKPPSQLMNDTRKKFALDLKNTLESYRPPNVWSAHMKIKKAEKASTAFCKQFKAPFQPQFIEELWKTPDWGKPEEKEEKDNEKVEITQPKEVLKEGTSYYTHLFGNKNTKENSRNILLEKLRRTKISKEEADSLGKLMTLEEVRMWCKKVGMGKSPGPDGIPSEFYKYFLNMAAPLLLGVFNEAIVGGELPSFMKDGIISLLYKKKDRRDIRNYRPVTLLNSDYKIFTKILTSRLKAVITQLIDPMQTGFVPGRFILENSQFMKLLQATLDEEDRPGLVLFLDMEKAFDRVSWDFLLLALEAMGFGRSGLNPDGTTAREKADGFTAMVKLMYDKDNPPRRQLHLNGYKGKWFQLQSGVAQGCPLSPLLFLFITEGLTRLLNDDPKVKGIKIQDKEIKFSMFADDTALCLRSYKSIKQVFKNLKIYEEATGMKVNNDKTEGLQMGILRRIDPPSDLKIKWVAEKKYVISLGIPIGNDIDEEEFWETKYTKTKAMMAKWKYVFGRTTKGRVLISKLMVYSRFRYWTQCMLMPKELKKNIEADIKALIWEKEPNFKENELGTKNTGFKRKMSEEAAYNPWGEGGMGLLHWESHLKALQAKWGIRYLDPGRGAWKLLLDKWIGNNFYCGRGSLLSSIPIEEILEKIPDSHPILNFWREAIPAFRELELRPAILGNEEGWQIEAEPAWHNMRMGSISTVNMDTWNRGLKVETIGDLWNSERGAWWSEREIIRFLAIEGRFREADKKEAIQDWNYIKGQIPKGYTEIMKKKETIKEDTYMVDEDDNTYLIQKNDTMRLITIDSMGKPHQTDTIVPTASDGLIPAATWGQGEKLTISGIGNKCYPQDLGWVWKGSTQDTKGKDRLSDITTKEMTSWYQRKIAKAPNCQEAWEERINFPLDWEKLWESFLKPGMFITYDYMPSFWHMQRATYVRNRNQKLPNHNCRICDKVKEDMIHLSRCEIMRKTFWKEIIQILNDIQGSKIKVHDSIIIFQQDKDGIILKRNQRGYIRLAWRIMYKHFTKVDEENIAFKGEYAVNEVLRTLYERILAAGEEAKLRAARRKGTDAIIGASRHAGENNSLAPFATLDSRVGTIEVNAKLLSILSEKKIITTPGTNAA